MNFYDFHPFKRGPFSELIYLDIRKLNEKGVIEISNYSIKIIDDNLIQNIISKLDANTLYLISDLVNKLKALSDSKIIDYVYETYPYYAINNPDRKEEFIKYDPRAEVSNKKPGIFTIGYEGKTIDKYINELILNNITILVDVRKNPQSMKYGFSTNRLKGICENRGIQYLLLSELGIEGVDRKDLNSYDDYNNLFKKYKKTLPQKKEYIYIILNLLKENHRVALTCFEADHNYCHRRETSNFLYNFSNKEYELRHL